MHPSNICSYYMSDSRACELDSCRNASFVRYHNVLGVQTLVGGLRFKDDLKRLELVSCQIVVATLGRLLDHVGCKSAFSTLLMGFKVLILDEADHLLDLGFHRDIERIVDCLPRRRQSLLFSTSISKEVLRISQLVLKWEDAFIDTVGAGCLETNSKVSLREQETQG